MLAPTSDAFSSTHLPLPRPRRRDASGLAARGAAEMESTRYISAFLAAQGAPGIYRA